MNKPINIDQSKDKDSGRQDFDNEHVNYIYRRASESRHNNVPGQDYLTFCSNENGLAFAVCDGVGQSFCGQLAAAFLGKRLIEKSDWIHENILDNQEDIAEAMTDWLNEQRQEGQDLVREFQLPANAPPLIIAALEESRRYGSETMFVYGFLEHAVGATNEQISPRLWLVWLGDTEVQVFTEKGQRVNLSAKWTTKERWSTTSGVKGTEKVHVWCEDASKVGRIIVYSDGIAAIADHIGTFVQDPDLLAKEIEQISLVADSDDISLLDINLSLIDGVSLTIPIPEEKKKDPIPKNVDNREPILWDVALAVLIIIAILVKGMYGR